MHKCEYWAHRLVPHMAFDDFTEKSEPLGGKKAVKVSRHVHFSALIDVSDDLFSKNALHRLRDQFNTHPLIDDDEQASRTLVSELIRRNASARFILHSFFCFLLFLA